MRFFGNRILWLVLLLAGAGVAVYVFVPDTNGQLRPGGVPFNGERAFRYLEQICRLGPRIAGTEGMARQQQMLTDHFTQLQGRVSRQEFVVRHPQHGTPVTLANLIVEWHPERRDRILLCTHYDTRPHPDEDIPANRNKPFLGANDGGSGTALLMELGRYMPKLASRYGVDFVFFDAEELIYDQNRDRYFLGSEHFARTYVATPPTHRYRYGVLLDMIADRELTLYHEGNSRRWATPVVLDIWNVADRLGVREFKSGVRHTVRDDHEPLNEIARIPTCDIIDFDFPRRGLSYWHTIHDTPENCSADSLAKVGWVIYEWLRNVDRTLPPK